MNKIAITLFYCPQCGKKEEIIFIQDSQQPILLSDMLCAECFTKYTTDQ